MGKMPFRTPERSALDGGGAPIGSEHHSPSSNKAKKSSVEPKVNSTEFDKKLKREYKKENSTREGGLSTGRFDAIKSETVAIGHGKSAEKRFRKETIK